MYLRFERTRKKHPDAPGIIEFSTHSRQVLKAPPEEEPFRLSRPPYVQQPFQI
jgi:hypothetical protein